MLFFAITVPRCFNFVVLFWVFTKFDEFQLFTHKMCLQTLKKIRWVIFALSQWQDQTSHIVLHFDITMHCLLVHLQIFTHLMCLQHLEDLTNTELLHWEYQVAETALLFSSIKQTSFNYGDICLKLWSYLCVNKGCPMSNVICRCPSLHITIGSLWKTLCCEMSDHTNPHYTGPNTRLWYFA